MKCYRKIRKLNNRPVKDYSAKWYKQIIGECCNPTCQSKMNLNTHHVKPLSQTVGGTEISNYIVLCAACHYGLGLHHNVRMFDRMRREMMLLMWKFQKELSLFGFMSANKTNDEFKKEVKAFFVAKIKENLEKL